MTAQQQQQVEDEAKHTREYHCMNCGGMPVHEGEIEQWGDKYQMFECPACFHRVIVMRQGN